jgi:DNA-binding NarL/FixJ family response regulator
MGAQSTIGVLVADDHEGMLRGIRQILQAEPSIAVVGEAASFKQLFEMVANLEPDVVVTDLRMRDDREFQPEVIKSRLSSSVVIAMSIWDDAETKHLASAYGAVTLLDKAKLNAELICAILQHSQTPKQAAD